MSSKPRSSVRNWMPGTRRLKRQNGQRFNGSLANYNHSVKNRRELRLKMEELIGQFNKVYKEPFEYYHHELSKPSLALDYAEKYVKKLNKLRDKFDNFKESDELQKFEKEYTETFETSKIAKFPWKDFRMQVSYEGGSRRTRKARR